MEKQPDTVTDPSPKKFTKQFIVVAVVLVVIGIIILILGKLAVGGIITLLGAVFGLGTKVVDSNKL
jgi:hypothetical protein